MHWCDYVQGTRYFCLYKEDFKNPDRFEKYLDFFGVDKSKTMIKIYEKVIPTDEIGKFEIVLKVL